MLKTDDIKTLCNDNAIVLTDHLLTRTRQRQIRLEDIKSALLHGEIIEQYPNDYPFPSCLVNGKGIHIVCSIGEGNLYIITAYRPSSEKWESEGKKRREIIL